MLTPLLLSLGLYVLITLLPPNFDYVLQGKFGLALGARDTPPPATLHGNRARRVLVNMSEAMMVFVPLALLTLILERAEGVALVGAWVFFAARLAYLPIYLLGLPVVRSAAWSVGLLGLGLMAWGLMG